MNIKGHQTILMGAVLGLASIIFVASTAWPASRFDRYDPFRVEALTTTEPSVPWIPDHPLAPVREPIQQPLPAEFNRPLSLAELTDLALRLNVRTRQAWLQARAEAAAVGIERADDLPQIEGLFSFRTGRSVSSTSGNPAEVRTTYGPSVTLSYVLYDFGQGDANVEAARYRLLAANLSQNRVLQDVVFLVELAYYRILGFEALVRASRESLTNFETAFDAAQRRRTSGLATAGDEYRAQTQVGQARLALSRNEGELSKARGQLANAVGLPVSYPLQLQAVSELPPVSAITASMDTLLLKAKSSRPDLFAAEARARAARANSVAISKAGLPSIELVSNIGRLGFPETSLPSRNVHNFGFNVRIPIFTGFRNTYSVRRAVELADEAESARDRVLYQAELEVWQAYFDLQTAASAVASTASLVVSAAESAAAASARYKAGVGTLLDFITAQLDDTNARVLQIQSYLDWYVALARLNFALGASDKLAFQAAR